MPRVALLALTVLAEMVNISQRSSNGSAGSRATIALSGILFVGVLLLLVALPAAFFRATIQDAKERLKSRKVRKKSRTRTIPCTEIASERALGIARHRLFAQPPLGKRFQNRWRRL